MRMTRIRKRKACFKSIIMSLNNISIAFMGITFLIGSFIGSIMLNTIDSSDFNTLLTHWNSYLLSDSTNNIIENIFRYGKIPLAIWLCGLFKYGYLGILLLALKKGVSIGFTSSFIIKITGGKGILFISNLYFIQSFILILLCFLAGTIGTKYCLNKNQPARNYNIKNYTMFGIFLLISILFLSLL